MIKHCDASHSFGAALLIETNVLSAAPPCKAEAGAPQNRLISADAVICHAYGPHAECNREERGSEAGCAGEASGVFTDIWATLGPVVATPAILSKYQQTHSDCKLLFIAIQLSSAYKAWFWMHTQKAVCPCMQRHRPRQVAFRRISMLFDEASQGDDM
jgi:hypothetical protein